MGMPVSIEWVVVAAVLAFVLARGIRIAAENQRYAVFRSGKYVGLKGPGLLLKLPVPVSHWERLSVGMPGEMLTPGIGQFNGVQVPVQVLAGVFPGAPIRIAGFTGNAVSAMLDR